jgi:BirA family biotin operon repressor/biotin-[acetyl-CoA-carboxylase] ligase
MSHLISWNIDTHQSLSSTQDTLKTLIADGKAEEGTLIRAIMQKGGYGRHGRKWEGASGNLSFSFMLNPQVSLDQKTTLSLVTGIALTRAIKNILENAENIDIVLKWPNDVMINGKKCAGILLENIEGKLIVGIGVNVASSPFEGATYLSEYSEIQIPDIALLLKFLDIFDAIYPIWLEEGFAAFRSDFMNLSYKKDTPVCVKLPQNTIEGSFQGVNEDGSMLIQCKDTQKLQKITAGDVFLV